MLGLPQFGPPASHPYRATRSLAASSGLHALVLVTLAVAALQTERTLTPPTTSAAAHFPLDVAGLDDAGIDGSHSGATHPQQLHRAAMGGPAATSIDSHQTALLPSPLAIDRIGLVGPQVAALETIDLVSIDRADEVDEPAPAGPAGAEQAGGGPGGGGNSFFGFDASGDKVVFVVDISGSMKGRRFFRARSELQRSIESLRAEQQFFVIFFSSDALPMPSEKLLPATPSNISQTIQWIKYVECGGGTNPLPGLMQAIALRPDAIYLLTDGKFDPQTVWEVSQAQPSEPIPIYTIGFASRSAEKLLKAIAQETGGVYRFVK